MSEGAFEAALENARHRRIDLPSALSLLKGAREGRAERSLFETVSRVRDRTLGRKLELTAHIHMIARCELSPACKYCSLSSTIRRVQDARDELPRRSLLDAVRYVTDRGVQSVVLVGGSDPKGSDAKVRAAVEAVRSVSEVELALDVGPYLSAETLDWLKGQNAGTVYCSIETSNPGVFRNAKPGDDLAARVALDETLEREGMRAGNIVMNGLGSTEDLVRSILFLRRFRHLSYLYISTFRPVRGTPYERKRPGSLRTSLKALAVARLVFPHVHLGLAEVEVEDPGSAARVASQLRAGGGNTFAAILIYRGRTVDNLDQVRREAAATGFSSS